MIAPGEGVLGDKVDEPKTKILEIRDGFCYFNGIKIPINPMIEVIGVATDKEDYTTGSQWKHGGNMDTADIAAGNSVYLPINQKGGLLALGDCHASMGDGEVCVTGLEISSMVLTRVNVVDGPEIEWPIVETDNHLSIICSGKTVNDAIKKSTLNTVNLLSKKLDLLWEEAYMLTSLNVDLRISQVVDPNATVRTNIPKSILETDKVFD